MSREFHCFARVSSPSWCCCCSEGFPSQWSLRKTSQLSFTQDPEWVDWLLNKAQLWLALVDAQEKKPIMCLSTLPHSFHDSVSLLSEILPTNSTSWANSAKTSLLRVSCAPSTDVSGYAPVLLCHLPTTPILMFFTILAAVMLDRGIVKASFYEGTLRNHGLRTGITLKPDGISSKNFQAINFVLCGALQGIF